MSSTLAVMSLFGGSFLSATLLPGNSEIILVALLTNSRVSPELLVLAATLGNTLGGLTNVIIGRLLPALKPQRGLDTALGWMQRFGPAAHALGPCRAVSVYRKGAALHHFDYDNVTGNSLVALTT